MLLEDILLLACRCLALGLLALAFARPFVRPDSPVPWAVTVPVLLLSMTAVGVSFALWRYPRERRMLFWSGVALFALAIGTIVFERYLNLKRFGRGATKDVVLLVDGSASMSIVNDGRSNFDRAVEEAKKYVELAPRNTSFAVILGGPVPQVLNPVPVSDRRIVMNALDGLHPVNGTMRIGANLTAAAVTLAAGGNAVKQIVILGDGQTVGWQLDDSARWKSLERAFATLKTHPIITWRTLPLPTSIRNLAIESVRPARSVVGTDREVAFAVTLVNAGTESVTPKGLTFTAEGHDYRARALQQLEPGESRVLTFRHRFKVAGGTVVRAKVDSDDDLPADDAYEYALPVRGTMKVLVVDGDSGARFNRAATYVSLALRPEFAGTDKPYLLAPCVEDVASLESRDSFAGFSSVILTGVRRLSSKTQAALSKFVSAGGGLLVLPQTLTDAANFNVWRQPSGAPVLPAALGAWQKNNRAIVADDSDLSSAVPERVLSFDGGWTSNAVVRARLEGGAPLVLEHRMGRGLVMLGAVNFDPASGLVSKRGFLPFLHELAYSLAQPSAVNLDVRPAEALTLLLASGDLGTGATGGNGLIGYYYPEEGLKGRPRLRIDKRIDFRWGTKSPLPDSGFPSDNFSVKWRGALFPPQPGKYKFWWHVDDRFKARIGTRELRNWDDIRLESRPYSFEGVFTEESGEARVTLCWLRPDGQKEPIPPSCFQTRAEGIETPGKVVAVADPHAEVFYAELFIGEIGLYLRIARPIVPGVYTVSEIPDSFAQSLAGVAGADGKVRFSVSSGVEESTMTAVTQGDLSKLSDYMQITQAIKDEDVIKSICGESFGKEIWRVFAFVAFLFLVLEPFIARWIAMNRRTGDLIDTEASWIRT